MHPRPHSPSPLTPLCPHRSALTALPSPLCPGLPLCPHYLGLPSAFTYPHSLHVSSRIHIASIYPRSTCMPPPMHPPHPRAPGRLEAAALAGGCCCHAAARHVPAHAHHAWLLRGHPGRMAPGAPASAIRYTHHARATGLQRCRRRWVGGWGGGGGTVLDGVVACHAHM